MRFRNMFALLLLLSIFLFSCSKEKSNEQPEQPSTETYQPASKGSTWHYKSDGGDFTLTATGEDSVISGITMHIFQLQQDGSPLGGKVFFGQKGDDYYAQDFFPQLKGVFLLYLKDNAAPGTKWTQNSKIDIPGMGEQNIEIDFVIQETDISKSVNNHTYSHVAHVSLSLFAFLNGSKIPAGSGDIYFSRGVGLIDVVIKNIASTSEVSLLDYSIK